MRRSIRSLQYFPVLYRLVIRLALWRKILRELRSSSLVGRWRLIHSAVIDSANYAVNRLSEKSPQACTDLVLYAPRLNVRFSVRGFTDDIYNILPFRELDVQDSILGQLRSGDVFVDVGANVGYYSVLAAKAVGPSGRVISVEAMPQTAERLDYNLKLNDVHGVTVVNRAILEAPTSDVVRIRVPDGQFGMASLTRAHDQTHRQTATVAGTTIDIVCARLDRIRSMKLDIEGSELAALRGAARTLRRTHSVVVECNQDEAAIFELLSNAGFRVEKLHFGGYLFASRSAQ